jgi:hypothetical protein
MAENETRPEIEIPTGDPMMGVYDPATLAETSTLADGDEIPATPPPDGYLPPPTEPDEVSDPDVIILEFTAAPASLAQVHAIELAQIGVGESPAGSNNNKFTAWYPMANAPWCDICQSWIFTAAGDALHFAYCPSHINAAKAAGVWRDGHAGIAIGDLVFYDWDHDGVADHIEWVESVGQFGIVTLGGNVADRFDRWSRGFGDVLGYGRPFYGSGDVPPPSVHPSMARPVPPLQAGSTGPQVVALQAALDRFGAQLERNGVFGDSTTKQLKNFQRFMGLGVDGQYGTESAKALDLALRGQGV